MPFAVSGDKSSTLVKEGLSGPRYSLVIPVYKNEENIPALIAELLKLDQRLGELEVVFVVDGSPDRSAEMLSVALERVPFEWQLCELSRNFGSFAAIRQGLTLAKAPLIAVMAADLQEPPELIDQFFQLLEAGEYDIAVGVRASRKDPFFTKLTSAVYWRLYSMAVMKSIPAGGVDMFACNRKFCDALLSLEERNSFLIGQLFWLGFRRIEVAYPRRPRLVGKSAWKFRNRLRYMLDSVFAFSDLPITLLLWLGAIGCVFSIAFSAFLLLAWTFGVVQVRGYVPTMLAIMFFGSLMVFGQGILGCYVWRISENTKKRPLSVVLSTKHRERDGKADPHSGAAAS